MTSLYPFAIPALDDDPPVAFGFVLALAFILGHRTGAWKLLCLGKLLPEASPDMELSPDHCPADGIGSDCLGGALPLFGGGNAMVCVR